jgi:hypothetical protein
MGLESTKNGGVAEYITTFILSSALGCEMKNLLEPKFLGKIYLLFEKLHGKFKAITFCK